ncbi:MAG: dethiobiotin synthase [Smithellaceae bacterium]
MTRGIYIIGTDTGVGKTAVAAGLMHLLLRNRCRAAYFKPVASGVSVIDGVSVSTDAAFVSLVSGFAERQNRVTSFVFDDAVAPHLAARMARRPIDRVVIKNSLDDLKSRYDLIIAESAGGLAVPLDADGAMQYDLIRELNFPCLLVARAGLGTINHTLLTLGFAKSVGLKINGIIISAVGGTLIEQDNVATIKKLSGIETILVLPTTSAMDTEKLQPGNLVEIVEQAVHIDDIINLMEIV